MNPRIYHIRTDVDAEFPNGPNPQCVAQNPQRNDDQSQQGALGHCAKKELAGDEAGDEQNQSGVDPAALGSNLQLNPGQLEVEPVAYK